MTTRCNLACRYCYLACTENGEDMPYEVFEAALNHLREAPKEIILSGGEPILARELLIKTVKTLRGRFPKTKISLQTNGLFLDAKLLDFLWEYKIALGLSLDGPPEVNEALRGETNSVIKTLKLLSEKGIGCGVTVTVSKDNALYLGETALFLSQFPAVVSFGLDLLRPFGRATEDMLPEPKALKEGLKGLIKALDWLAYYGKILIFREITRGPRRKGYCPAVRGSSLVVTPSGEAYPCASLAGQKNFLAGSVFNRELKALGLPDTCSSCPERKRCPGRCPSRTLSSKKAAFLDCLMRQELARNTEGINASRG